MIVRLRDGNLKEAVGQLKAIYPDEATNVTAKFGEFKLGTPLAIGRGPLRHHRASTMHPRRARGHEPVRGLRWEPTM